MSVKKMRDSQKTKAELLQEVETLRKRVAKLMQTEEELRESEEKWRSLLNNTPDIVMIVDRDGTIRFINHTAPGFKIKETIGKKVYDYIRPEHYDMMRRNLEKVFQTGHCASHEISRVGRSGELSWYQAELGPIKQDGHIVAASIITRDITEHRRIEDTLRRSEENYRILVENQTDMVVKFDTDGTLLFVSPSYCKTFGKSQEELNGSKFMPLIHEEDRKKVAETLNKVYNPPYTGYVEERALTKDGWRWQAWLNTAVLNNEKKIESIIGVGRDITEHKRADDALWESEKRFREIFENTAVGMYRTTPDGQILMANPALLRMLGYSSFEELSQRNLEEEGFEPQYQRSKFKEEIEREGRIVSLESTWITLDGKKLHVIENVRAVRDEDGKTLYYEGTAENITERKWAEEALRESENKYRTLFNDIADPIFVADFETGILIDCNRAASELVGREKSELIGKHQRILHPPKETEGEFSRTFEQHCKEKRGQVLKAQVITKKGVIKDVAIRADFTELENNKRILFGMFRDITEHKRAEEALRESEKKYKALFQGAEEGIIVADTETKEFKYVNPAICTMLGYTEDELKQMGVRDIHPKEDLEYIISEFEAQARGEKTLASNIPCLRKDGTIMYADINTAMVLMDGRKCNVGFFADITEHKQALEELNEYREKMAHAEQLASLGTLSATLAHELNQPLTAIRLSIENSLAGLETTSSPDTVIEDLKGGLSAVSDVASRVNVLRDFAQKSSKEIISEVNLKAVAERILNLLNESARRAKVTLQHEGMEELPHIRSNEKDLEQLFFALVENAIEAADGKKNRRLIISGVVKDEHIELRFADDCCGIAPGNLDKIFEPFFTTSPPSEGTGLGLCIVERIVSRAGGNIRVESKAGKGSTFFVTLPINRGGRF